MEVPQYQISRKSIERERERRADTCGRTERHEKKRTGAFRDYANAPNKNQYGILCIKKMTM